MLLCLQWSLLLYSLMQQIWLYRSQKLCYVWHFFWQFRQYDALRKEHDTQIVQIAIEAGLRISPEQWSSLLYGDLSHKSHMQSIIDKVKKLLEKLCEINGKYLFIRVKAFFFSKLVLILPRRKEGGRKEEGRPSKTCLKTHHVTLVHQNCTKGQRNWVRMMSIETGIHSLVRIVCSVIPIQTVALNIPSDVSSFNYMWD